MEAVQLTNKLVLGNVRNGDSLLKVGNKAGYYQQYNLRNKEKTAEYLARNEVVKLEYHRQYSKENPRKRSADSRRDYFRQYKERNSEYHSRDEDLKLRRQYKREYYHQNKERNNTDSTETVQTDGFPLREYQQQNKEKAVDYNREYYRTRQEYYNRNDEIDLEERRRNTLAKKESLRLYFGSQKSNQSWRSPEVIREFFESIATHLNVANISDWQRISREQIGQRGGISLYNKFGSLGAALQYAYPEIEWDLSAFGDRGKKKSGQRRLKVAIKSLLPASIEVVEDYQHPDLSWDGESERNMELDLWIPHHRIGLEYQGEQHFYNVDSFGPSSGTGSYSERDSLKRNLCESRGITLIAIPYWWDGSADSLSATLYKARPDVFPASHASPIPHEMPLDIAPSQMRFRE